VEGGGGDGEDKEKSDFGSVPGELGDAKVIEPPILIGR
jgi:hypothetical protein